MCDNKVDYYVPKGYDYKKLVYPCGATGIDGRAVLCDQCSEKVRTRQMPEPGYCIHGVAISDYDCDCFRCEMGED